MPLNKKKTKAAFEENLATERNAGKSLRQALAIAYSVKGEKPKNVNHPMVNYLKRRKK